MKHDWYLLGAVFSNVMRIKAIRHREIGLNRTALPFTVKTILQYKLNFGSIKGSLTLLELPVYPFSIKRRCKCRLSLIPNLIGANPFFRSSREFNVNIFKTKVLVDLER